MVSSALKDGATIKRQACYLPLSPDGTPLIGAIPHVDGAFVATGAETSASTLPPPFPPPSICSSIAFCSPCKRSLPDSFMLIYRAFACTADGWGIRCHRCRRQVPSCSLPCPSAHQLASTPRSAAVINRHSKGSTECSTSPPMWQQTFCFN